HGGSGGEEQLCAVRPCDAFLAQRVEAVGVRARRDPQQTALGFSVVTAPRKYRGILGQQLLQTFDVVVMNDTSSLYDCPLQPLVQTFAHLSGEVLPTCVTILTRNHELSIALRHRQVNVWQLRPGT